MPLSVAPSVTGRFELGPIRAPAGGVVVSPGQKEPGSLPEARCSQPREASNTGREGVGTRSLKVEMLSILKVTVNLKLRSLFTWQIGVLCLGVMKHYVGIAKRKLPS